MIDIPEDIMQALREREELDKNDTSMDDEIKERDPMENLRELTAWRFGDTDWADEIIRWARQLGMQIWP